MSQDDQSPVGSADGSPTLHVPALGTSDGRADAAPGADDLLIYQAKHVTAHDT